MIGDVLDITLLTGMMVAFFASAMTIYAGFGGALVMVPLFTMLIGPVQAVALMAICSVVAYTHVMPALARQVNWREVVPVALGLLFSISIGSYFLVSSSTETIRFGMAIFILAAAGLLLVDYRYSGPRGFLPSSLIGGLTGGIMGGFGVPAGPILVIYYLATDEQAARQRANIMFSVWLLIIIMLGNLLARDAVETSTYLRSIFIVPVSILGGMAGQYAFRRVPVNWFKSVAHWLLVAIGLSLLLV